jgi:putative ABC transport system permease protein
MFSVTVFFIYSVVIFHPDISNYEFRYIVQNGVVLSQVIIYGFSFLFVLYSTSSFIKSRQKEYGLLTTLGISKSQLNRLLILENTIIGISSIAAGITVGSLLTKLFLMVFSLVLNMDHTLTFYISFKAIGLTVLLFFIMFEINSFAVVWTLRTKSVMDVFRGSKATKKAPKFSYILSSLSIACVGYAYYLAYTADWTNIIPRMGIILAYIIPGTYFLYTQLGIAFTNGLRKNKHFYYRALNMLTVSDLTFKLKDNARLLFLVTILSAVAFTSSGVLYGLLQSAQTQAKRFVPQDVTLITKGEDNQTSFLKHVKEVEKEFKKKGISFDSKSVRFLFVNSHSRNNDWDDLSLAVYSYSDYRNLVEMNQEKAPPKVSKNDAYIMASELDLYLMRPIKEISIRSKNETSNSLHIKMVGAQLNSSIFTNYTMVIPDEVFDHFYQTAENDEIMYMHAMHTPNWMHYANDIADITDYDFNENFHADSQADFYVKMREGMSYTFFFGIFISVLFFLAAGSILYFRIYQDIDKDLHHFHSLYRIGLTNREMKNIATKQLSILFFVPFFVAVIHAVFAFKILQNLLSSSVMVQSLTVILIYFVIHFANFIFIRNIYTAKLKKVM